MSEFLHWAPPHNHKEIKEHSNTTTSTYTVPHSSTSQYSGADALNAHQLQVVDLQVPVESRQKSSGRTYRHNANTFIERLESKRETKIL